MTVLEAIAQRRSVRSYKPDPVPEEMLIRLVEAAHQAPSSRNFQPWEFIIVTDPELKRRLREAANNQAHVEQAGATFICLASFQQLDKVADRLLANIPADATAEYRERVMRTVTRIREDQEFRRSQLLANSYIAIAYLTLAAQEMGLGTVWMGGYDPEKVKAIFDIPDTYLVAALVSVGWPADGLALPPRSRRPLAEIYGVNRLPGR
jgi:nitroreductase